MHHYFHVESICRFAHANSMAHFTMTIAIKYAVVAPVKKQFVCRLGVSFVIVQFFSHIIQIVYRLITMNPTSNSGTPPVGLPNVQGVHYTHSDTACLQHLTPATTPDSA